MVGVPAEKAGWAFTTRIFFCEKQQKSAQTRRSIPNAA